MRRADRLFQIIQVLRRSSKPVTADAMAAETRVWNEAAFHRLLDEAEAAGCDELILVPGTVDTDCLDRTAALVASRS